MSTETSWLPQTKLYPPLPRDDVLLRPRLVGALRQSLTSYPLTLLSAPAGYGKTSLLAALPQAYPDFPLAWLTLDQDDNDPARFLTALMAALRRLNPACGATAQAVLESLPEPGAERSADQRK
jgi:LuxR family maltose regulon positive regulatory protein